MAVGVDFHFDAAIGKDRFGHHGDHIRAIDLLADNKRRWFEIGVGGAGPDGGDEFIAIVIQIILPVCA